MKRRQKKLNPIAVHMVSAEFTHTMIKVNALMFYSLVLFSQTIP